MYKDQPIGGPILQGVLGNVPIWHPRTHDAERKQCLRNFDDGKHIRMGLELSLPDHKTVYLAWSVLSTSLMK